MNRFHIIIPVYNAEQFIKQCLQSAFQDYARYDVTLVDDCSTDRTLEIADRFPIDIIHNITHTGSAIQNLKRVAERIKNPDDIIVCLDGDDYLFDRYVLNYLNTIYHRDVWLTYGQNISLSGKHDRISMPLTAVRTWKWEEIRTISLHANEYRQYGLWHTSHLRTFRKGLFNLIRDEDLRYSDGEYFRTCCDVCAMYPMIEMAGDKHVQYVDKILYVYNDINNNYNDELRAKENIRNMEYLQSKPNYEEIPDYRL